MSAAPDLLRSAQWYARRGLPVFPCRARTKDPATPHGFQDAATDLAQIARWWSATPDANVALAVPVGMVVVDVDSAPGKPDGQPWAAAHPELLPPTVTNCTSGAGTQHLYLGATDGLVQRSLAESVDTRIGGKGYILLPPSIHPTGIRYRWAPGAGLHERALVDAPAALLALLAPPPAPLTLAARLALPPAPTDALGARKLERALSRGQLGNRNATGFWLALQLRDNGFTESDAERLVLRYQALVPQGAASYTTAEAIQSVRQAYRRPPRQPDDTLTTHPAQSVSGFMATIARVAALTTDAPISQGLPYGLD